MIDRAELTKVLQTLEVAKSRREKVLTNPEISRLVELISENEEVIFTPSTSSLWIGMDQVNSVVISGDTEEEIVEAWQDENGVRDVVHVSLGDGAGFYQQIRGPEDRQELFIFRSDVLGDWGLEMDEEGNVTRVT